MKHFFKSIINSVKIDLIPLIYFCILFYFLIFLKKVYVNTFAFYLEKAGYIKLFRFIKIKHPLLIISIFIFFIILILGYLRGREESAFKYAILVFIAFLFLGTLYLFFDLFEVTSFIYFIMYGGLISVIFGLKYVKLRPNWMDKKNMKSNLKLELIKISISNWWRGLTIFTTILIAIFISALLSWIKTPPPAEYKILSDISLKQAFFLFVFALPGLIFIYVKILKQIKYFENLIFEL